MEALMRIIVLSFVFLLLTAGSVVAADRPVAYNVPNGIHHMWQLR